MYLQYNHPSIIHHMGIEARIVTFVRCGWYCVAILATATRQAYGNLAGNSEKLILG